jgi:hypothetical protein
VVVPSQDGPCGSRFGPNVESTRYSSVVVASPDVKPTAPMMIELMMEASAIARPIKPPEGMANMTPAPTPLLKKPAPSNA